MSFLLSLLLLFLFLLLFLLFVFFLFLFCFFLPPLLSLFIIIQFLLLLSPSDSRSLLLGSLDSVAHFQLPFPAQSSIVFRVICIDLRRYWVSQYSLSQCTSKSTKIRPFGEGVGIYIYLSLSLSPFFPHPPSSSSSMPSLPHIPFHSLQPLSSSPFLFFSFLSVLMSGPRP